jgi:hypothetical protein
MKFFPTIKPMPSGLLTGLLCTAVPAFAGGLQAGSQAASSFQIWLYSFIGILALCYLSYKAGLAFTDREHWSDFGWGCLKVTVTGASVVIAAYLWNLAAG